MNRMSRALVVLPVGLVLCGLAACSSNVSGNGNGNLPAANSASAASATDASSAGSSAAAPSAPTAPHTVVVTATETKTAAGSTPTKSSAPKFVVLKLAFDKACAPEGGVTEVDAILTWQVSNATGIEVNIDNTSRSGATVYNMTSGSQDLTSVQCAGGSKYTFDVWTVGGAGGQQAHKQLSYTSSS